MILFGVWVFIGIKVKVLCIIFKEVGLRKGKVYYIIEKKRE